VVCRSETLGDLITSTLHFFGVVEFLNDSGKVCKKFQGVSDHCLEDFVNEFSVPSVPLKTNLLEYSSHISEITGLSQSHLTALVACLEKDKAGPSSLASFQTDAFLLNSVTDILGSPDLYPKFKPYLIKLCANFFLCQDSLQSTLNQLAREKTVFVKCISSLNQVPRTDFFCSFKHSHFTEFSRFLRRTVAHEFLNHFGTIIEVTFNDDYMMEYMNMFGDEEQKYLSPVLCGEELLLPPLYPFKVVSAEVVRKTFHVRVSVPVRWFLNPKTTAMLILRKTSLKYDKAHLFNDLSRIKEEKEGPFFPPICHAFPKFYLGFELMRALGRNKFLYQDRTSHGFQKNVETILRVLHFFFKYLSLKNFVTPITLDELVQQSLESKRTFETVVLFILVHNSQILFFVAIFSFNLVNYIEHRIDISESKDARSYLQALVGAIGSTENFFLSMPFLSRSAENTEMLFNLNNVVRGLIDIKVTNRLYLNMPGNDFCYFLVNVLLDSDSITRALKELYIVVPYNEVQEKSLDFILKLKQSPNLSQLRLNFSNSPGFDQQCLLGIKSKLDFSDFNRYLVIWCKGTNLRAEQAAVFIQSYQLEYQSLKLQV